MKKSANFLIFKIEYESIIIKKGLHIVVIYLVIGDWRFPWSFRVYRGKDTPSPSQLGQKLLKTLPKILTKSFRIYVLGDTAFGTINLINQKYGFESILDIFRMK